MKTIKIFKLVSIFFIINSCSFVEEISTFKGLEENLDNRIQVVTKDTTVYYADRFTYSDTSIIVSGTKTKFGVESKSGEELKFKDIIYIQTKQWYFFPSAAYIGLNLFLLGNGMTILMGKSGIELIVEMSESGGSCPYIYSWNGNNYYLEGEAFGTSLGKAMETETCIILNNLKSENNKLKLRLSNERPETHFFNNIQFYAIETKKNETAYADNNNSICIVSEHKNNFRAIDFNNNDITNKLAENDNDYWISDLSSASPNYCFEDQIIIELKDVKQIDSLSLVVSAINTEISNIVFSYLQNILGDEFVNFTKACETDQELISTLEKTLFKSALKFDIWDGKTWKYVGCINPEANHVNFQKLIRLPLFTTNNSVRLRLRCMTDLWKIDAISFDDTPRKYFTTHQPKLTYYKINDEDNINSLLDKDDEYIKLLPGQSILLEFEDIKIEPGKNVSYAVTVGGYLYEWIIDNNNYPSHSFKNLNINTPKISLLKEALKNIDSFLPVIYNEWREMRYKYELSKM